MAMDAQTIAEMIRSGIPGAIVKIEDLRGDGEHYSAQVTSAAFKGMSRVQQHQMVYKALQGKMGGELHALAIHTSTPKN
jgi:stress-induced morphogen